MKNDNYQDIINLPHHVSKKRQQMPISDRAAEFAPFAALTGYEENIKEATRLTDTRIEIDEDLKRRENTIIALLLDANVNIFNKVKEHIKPEDFKYEINQKIANELYKELEKQETNITRLVDNFDEETQNHITMVMATDYEIENLEKAVDDILQKYEKERLDNRKQEILKQLELENDGEKKKELGKELSNIIIALAKIK